MKMGVFVCEMCLRFYDDAREHVESPFLRVKGYGCGDDKF